MQNPLTPGSEMRLPDYTENHQGRNNSQRFTFAEKHEQQPLACLLDYFPGGLLITDVLIRNNDLLRVVGLPADLSPEEVGEIEAAVFDFDAPASVRLVYQESSLVCVPDEWIEPLSNLEEVAT